MGSEVLFHGPFSMASLLGTLSGILFFIVILPIVEAMQSRELHRAWRKRLEVREGLPQPSIWRYVLDRRIRSLDQKLDQLIQSGWADSALRFWRDSGVGLGPLSLLICLILVIAVGFLLGQHFLSTAILKISLQGLLLTGFMFLIYYRAIKRRRLFGDQFPAVLERLSDSLQAGFSLAQALELVVPNLSQPSRDEMALISYQIKLGFTVNQALTELYLRRPSEDVRIFVEGIILQRTVGGNLASMMRDLARLVRSRLKLENEIKAVTAQGRLSAVVIALLGPISLGILSLFPGYTDVLFKSTIGNLVLVAAGFLEILGAALVARVIRIKV